MVNSFLGYSRVVICLFILATSVQCTTNVKGRGVKSIKFQRPLRDVRKAIYYAMGGNVPRKSQNGRTHYSPWHQTGKKLNSSAFKKATRGQLQITLLGDRRPYWVIVVYRVEKLDGKEYELDRYDMKIANKYLEKIEDFLAARPEERDVIDDFRPY